MAETAIIANDLDREIRQARVDLAAAYRLCVRFGWHEGICNHLSLMLPGSPDRFLLGPHGLHWSEITASSLLVVDFDGNVVEGDGIAEDSAFYIHARVHMADAAPACALHSHQPNPTALTMLEDGRLEMALQTSLRFFGRIAYDDDYQGLGMNAAEGDRLAACLGDKEVLFMGHHGVMVTGPSVAQAMDALYYLDRACEVQIKAMSTGRPLKPISDNLAQSVHVEMMANVPAASLVHFEALKRILDREEPDYKD